MLRDRSISSRESVAALIRKAIDRFLVTGKPDRAALYRQAVSVVEKYGMGETDIAVDHDRYLGEVFGVCL